MTATLESEAPTTEHRSGRSDVSSGLVVAVVGAVLLVFALHIETTGKDLGIGPRTLPVALSVMLIVSGLLLVGLGLRRVRVMGIERELMHYGDAEDLGELVLPDEPPVPPRRLVVVVAMFIGYALIFIPLGYMVSTALYLAAMVTVIDRARWKRNLVFAVLFAVIVYYAFTRLLAVQLPVGILG
jgi:putative tricarboxylic transport membrane protein